MIRIKEQTARVRVSSGLPKGETHTEVHKITRCYFLGILLWEDHTVLKTTL